jgi:hypothetical protein
MAPLAMAALIAGALLCSLALFTAGMREVARNLAAEPMVVRSLGATLAVVAFMLVRVGARAASGVRRPAAVVLGVLIAGLGAALLISPAAAQVPYARGWSVLVPWVLALPGILALGLARWSMRS